jgi:hypothetical protein
LYRRWKKHQDVVLRQDHRPGEKLFLDWACATIPIHHRDGSVTQAPLFVSALGVSSYTYPDSPQSCSFGAVPFFRPSHHVI